MATAAVTQGTAATNYGVCWYEDDNATPSSMTPLCTQAEAATEGSFTRRTGTDYRMIGRVIVQNSSAALWNSARHWEYRYKPSGEAWGLWTTLNASSSYIRTTTLGTPADDASSGATVLSGGSGTYEAEGYYNESDGVPPDPGLGKNNYQEECICVYIVDAHVSHGDRLQIRMAGTAITTYLQHPTVEVDKSIAPVTVTPSPVTAALSIATPALVIGALTLTPSPVTAAFSATTPASITNITTIAPTPVSAAWSVGTPVATGPRITDAGDEDFRDKEAGVVITGTGFGDVQGTVELGDNAVYGSANRQAQTITNWTSSSITVTVALGSLTPGALYLYVTDDAGGHSASYAVTVHRAVAIRLALSTHIGASGEDTGAMMTPPATKSTGDFGGGRIQDDENPGDTVDLAADEYREDEWCLKATTDAADAGVYEFRVLYGGAAASTISVTPTVTISGAEVLTPSPVTAAFSVATPVVTYSVTVAPDPVTAAFSVATPTATPGGLTLTPDAVTAAFAVATPAVVKGGLTLTPSPVTAAFAVATPSTALTQSPSATTAAFSVATPTVTNAVTLTPSAVTAAFAVATPTTGFVQTPSAVAAAFSVTAPSLDRVQYPSPVTAAFGVATPDVTNAVTVTPDATTAAFAVATPATVMTSTPAAVAAAFSVATPTLAYTVTPDAVTAAFGVATPAVVPGGLTLTPDAVASAFVAVPLQWNTAGTNGTFEVDTTGVTAVSATLAREAVHPWEGSYALKVTVQNSGSSGFQIQRTEIPVSGSFLKYFVVDMQVYAEAAADGKRLQLTTLWYDGAVPSGSTGPTYFRLSTGWNKIAFWLPQQGNPGVDSLQIQLVTGTAQGIFSFWVDKINVSELLLSYGNVTLTPDPVMAAWGATTPTSVTNGFTATPDAVAATFAVASPTTAFTQTPSAVTAAFGIAAPTVTPGAVTLTPSPVTAAWSVASPTTAINVNPDAVTAGWEALTRNIVPDGYMVNDPTSRLKSYGTATVNVGTIYNTLTPGTYSARVTCVVSQSGVDWYEVGASSTRFAVEGSTPYQAVIPVYVVSGPSTQRITVQIVWYFGASPVTTWTGSFNVVPGWNILKLHGTSVSIADSAYIRISAANSEVFDIDNVTITKRLVTYGSLTETPDPVSAAFTVAAPTVTNVFTATPDPAAAAFSVATPSLTLTYEATPSPVVAAFSVVTPSVVGSSDITPSPVTAAFGIATPATRTTLSPTAAAATWSVATPSVTSNYPVAPSPVTAAFGVAAPSLTLTYTATPDPVTAAFSVAAPTLAVTYEVTPAAVTAAFSVGTPAAATTLTPAAVTAAWSVATPTVVAGAEPQEATPSPVTAAWGVATPTVSATYTVTPTPVAGTFSVGTPAVGIGAVTLTPDAATCTWSVGTPGLLFGPLTLTPDPTVGAWSAATPALLFGPVTLTPDPTSCTWAVGTPGLVFGGVTLSPTPTTGSWTVPTPSITGPVTVAPPPVTVAWSVPTPHVSGGGAGLGGRLLRSLGFIHRLIRGR